MKTNELTPAQLAHAQAVCQVVGTAFVSLTQVAPSKKARRLFDNLVTHIIKTNSKAIARAETALLANDGEASKRLDVGFTVSI